jgi:8-oxo-dGTP pyrophosphatase MutT (NUDIX family)
MKTFKEFFTEKKSDLRTEATAWVILYTSDKVMLGKRAPTTKNPNQWNFFGGHLDKGETAVQAAVRELKEETGYTMSVSKLKEISTIGTSTYFAARIEDPQNIKTTDEISKVKPFKLIDLPDNLHAKTANFFDSLDHLFA